MAATIRIAILADANQAVRAFRETRRAAAETNLALKNTGKALHDLDGRTARIGLETRGIDAGVRDMNEAQRAAVATDVAMKKLNGKTARINLEARGFASGLAQIVTAHLILDRLRKGLPDLSLGLTGVANKFTLYAAGAAAATAAVMPLIAATVAIGAALGAAALGLGLFAAVAAPTFKTVTTAVNEYNTASHAFDRAAAVGDTTKMAKAQQDMASALGALNPAQRAAAVQMIAMKKSWDDLSASQAPLVLDIMTDAARTLAGVIPKLTPAITAMGGAVKSVSADAFAGLAKSVGPMTALITSQGVPAFKNIAATVGNLAVVVGHLVTSFAPLGGTILATLVPVTAALRSFNFDALASSASALLPVITSLMANIGGAIANLAKAAAPLAGPVLQALSDIAAALKAALGGPEIKMFVANLVQIVPAVAPIATVLIGTFAKFAAIISGALLPLLPQLLPLISQIASVFVNVLTGLSPLLPALLGLVGVLVSLLPVVFPIVTALRVALVPVVEALGAALTASMPAIAAIVAGFISLLGPVSGLLVAILPLVPVLVNLLAPILAVVASALGGLVAALTPIIPVVVQVAQAVSSYLLTVLQALMPVFPPILAAIGQLAPVFVSIVQAVLPILPAVATLAATLVTALLPAFTQLLPAVVVLGNILSAVLPVAVAILLPLFTGLTTVIANPAFAFLAKVIVIIVVALKVWTAIQWLLNIAMLANPLGLIIIAIVAVIAIIVLIATKTTWFQDIWKVCWDAIKVAAGAVWDFIKGIGAWFAGPFANFFVTGFNLVKNYIVAVVTWISGKVNAIIGYFTAIPGNLASMGSKILGAISGGIGSLVTFFSSKVASIIAFFTSIPGKVASVGRDLVNGLVNGISGAWGAVTAKVRSLIDKIPQAIRDLMGIHSPSRVMAQLGANITLGLAGGILSKVAAVRGAMGQVNDAVASGVTVPAASFDVGGGGGGAGAGGVINITVNVPAVADPAEVGRQVIKAIKAHQAQVGRQFLVGVA